MAKRSAKPKASASPKDEALRALTRRVARQHWSGKHHLALAAIAQYLGEAGTAKELRSKPPERRLGQLSDHLRALTRKRGKAELKALWTDPYAWEFEQKWG